MDESSEADTADTSRWSHVRLGNTYGWRRSVLEFTAPQVCQRLMVCCLV